MQGVVVHTLVDSLGYYPDAEQAFFISENKSVYMWSIIVVTDIPIFNPSTVSYS